MDIPTLLFGTLLALILGAIYHLLRGGRFGRLLIFLLFSCVGFVIGQWLGVTYELGFIKLGGVYLLPAAASSLVFLAIGDWLSLKQPEKKRRR